MAGQRVVGDSPPLHARKRSTPSIDEQGFQESSPLMKHIPREPQERFGGWVDDDLSREAPFQKQVRTGRLWASWDDHETVQMVLLRVARCESRLTPRVIGDIDEAHNQDLMYLRTRRLAESAARKEQNTGVPLLGK